MIMFSSRSPILFLLATLLCIIPELTTAASCSNFEIYDRFNNESIYTATLANIRVSAIVNCSGSSLGTDYPTSSNDSVLSNTCNNTQCALFVPTDYAVEFHGRLNVSLPSSADVQTMLAMIKSHLDLPAPQDYDFNETSVHFVGGSATCLSEGRAGWWNFVPTFQCTEGWVSGCSGNGAPADRTPVQACGLRLLRDDHSLVEGSVNIVATNEDPAPVPANATINSSTTPADQNGAASLDERFYSSFAFWGVLLAAVTMGLQM